MKSRPQISERDRRMLELLAQGSSSKAIAKKLGYTDGSTRVYLHGLYRKIGVNNKTAALLWYLDRSGKATVARSAVSEALEDWRFDRSFGDMALRTSLFTALGVMSMFLGAYGKTWEVGQRLKGAQSDKKAGERQRQSRLLWEALLKGNFAYGKQLFDENATAGLLADSPSVVVLLASLLLVGGYSSDADKVIAQLARRRKGRAAITVSELTLLQLLRDALNSGSDDALASIYNLASDHSSLPTHKHVAMVLLYWAYWAKRDTNRARAAANAVCAEAEAVRQQLQALGERPVYGDSELPKPATTTSAKGLQTYLRKLTGATEALKVE